MQTLPNFIIVGVPKAGTTSLFAYLAQHPEVCPSSVKEIEYFRSLRVPGGRLPSLSAYAEYFKHWQGEHYRMEASPSYSYGGEPVIRGIQETLDRPRVLISLREPVARLWSAYTFQRSRARVGRVRSFEEFVEDCERQRDAGTDRALGNRRIALSVGFYADYVPLWLTAFGSDCFVVFADQLFDNPPGVVRAVCDWLGISSGPAADFDYATRNRTAHSRSTLLRSVAHRTARTLDGVFERLPALETRARQLYERINAQRSPSEKLTPETRARLELLYADSNACTAAHLQAHGYDKLPAWLTTRSGTPLAG